MTKLKIAICDDEEHYINQTASMLEHWSEKSGVAITTRKYISGEALLFDLEENNDFDAIFLDIRMNTSNGLEVAHKIRKKNENIIIIFITSLFEYVLKGYEVQAFRYLIKPIKQKDISSCLDKILQKTKINNQSSILIKFEGNYTKIPCKDILYFEIFSHYINIHLIDDKIYYYKKKISSLEEELPEIFIRCHRSMIVNVEYIFSINRNNITLQNKKNIPISKSRYDHVYSAFSKCNIS